MVAFSMKSIKLTVLGLLKIELLLNESYYITTFVLVVIGKNFINWVKVFCKSGHSIKVRLLQLFNERSYNNFNIFLMGSLGSSLLIQRWYWVWPWLFTEVWQKQFKLKFRKNLERLSTFIEVTAAKLARRKAFLFVYHPLRIDLSVFDIYVNLILLNAVLDY